MSVSSLREITVGAADLEGRTALFEKGCGLKAMASGLLAPMTASRLFDLHEAPGATVLGRPDLPDSPRVRLVEARDVPPSRTLGIEAPGPLGIGFTTLGIDGVRTRLEQLGVHFVSPPVLLSPMSAPMLDGVPPGPKRYETFGRTVDGDFIVLIERVNAETPYGTIGVDCSEPLHASFVVTNLDTCIHFMNDVLEHETLLADTCAGSPFDVLLGQPPEVSFRFAMPHRPGCSSGRLVFMEFERRREAMAQTPSRARGLCRLRYDTTNLHATLERVPGGGGSLVRGPASVDDPILGQGLVALVRAPFGVLIELWQTS